jgi:hypothetical protein
MKNPKNNLSLLGCTYGRDATIRKLFAMCIFLAFILFGKAQEFSPVVIASAGTSATSATCIVDWTLGEIAIETLTQPSVILTQGFQQNFIGGPTAIEIAESSEFSLYPNPARDQLYLSLKLSGKEKCQVEIINLKGTKVWNITLESSKNIEKIDVNRLPSGMYMLKISTPQGKTLKSTKFIKL